MDTRRLSFLMLLHNKTTCKASRKKSKKLPDVRHERMYYSIFSPLSFKVFFLFSSPPPMPFNKFMDVKVFTFHFQKGRLFSFYSENKWLFGSRITVNFFNWIEEWNFQTPPFMSKFLLPHWRVCIKWKNSFIFFFC